MIKRVRPIPRASVEGTDWLNLDDDVEVEVTSEDPGAPIEGALLPHLTKGWRAATTGAQTIALIWRAPIRLRRIHLVFEEHSEPRTQEFVLRASTIGGEREVVRQQFTFSPPGTTREREEYAVQLDGVVRLELTIVPAIDRTDAVATLQEWRVS